METAERSADNNRLTVLGVSVQILRGRRLVLGLPAALFILVVGTGLIGPRKYSSNASFIPASSASNLSRLSSLAAQFGLPGASWGGGGVSADFYADFLRSGELVRALVHKKYAFAWRGDSIHGDLIDLFEIREQSPGSAEEKAVKRMRSQLTVTRSLKTGVVGVSIRTRYPELSVILVDEALALVNDFNLQFRQSQAGADRQFAEDRLADAQAKLRSSEDEMQRFLQQNREFRSSPQLLFEQARMQRNIDLHQQVVLSLAQAYEQSRIEEVRNTPVITVVERPVLAARPVSRLLLLKGLLALMVGVLLAVGILILQGEFAELRGMEAGTAGQLTALWRDTMEDLRRPIRAVRRGGGKSGPDTGSPEA